MHKLLAVLIALFSFYCGFAQISIEDARSRSIGAEVTITGVVTNSSELGVIRYMQDETAGLAIYSPSDFANDANRGDSVIVTGILKDFNGLLELDPVSDYQVYGSGYPLPQATTLSPNQINEDLESQLVRFENVLFDDGGSTISSNGVYSFQTNGEEFRAFFRSNHPLLGENLPLSAVNLTGIISEYQGTYQLLIRDENDIEPISSFFIENLPTQSNISTAGFTISWTTSEDADATVEYGLDENLGQVVQNANQSTSHSIDITGLQAATFYYVKVSSSNGSETTTAPVGVYTTQSNSSGEMKVYFNNSVDASFSNGSTPESTTGSEMNAAFTELIDNAGNTIDIAAYNNNRTEIIQSLNDAVQRGVRVRYIYDDSPLNSALLGALDFPTYSDAGSPDGGLMHHKFMVIDAEDVDKSYVWTGSTNLTDENIGRDYNNSISIQDQALARAYVKEFEEMWGSDGDMPGFFGSRFASQKKDDTPHTFNINGTKVELYFSPSDPTSLAIERAVRGADDNLQLALLTFTYNSLGTAVVDEYFDGTNVRVLMENGTDQGSEYDYLESRGVSVFIEATNKQLHHKYGIVDHDASDPTVITGSHNWTNSAETRNDENALIIHDADVANLFIQEYEKRWAETVTGLEYVADLSDITLAVGPIPTVNELIIDLKMDQNKAVKLGLYNMSGSLVQETETSLSQKLIWDLSSFNSGVYILILSDDHNVTYRKIVVE